MVSFPIFVAAAAQTVRQFGEIKGIENTTPIGGSALMAPGFLEAAGDTAVDLVFTNPDTAPDAMGNRYRELVEKYHALNASRRRRLTVTVPESPSLTLARTGGAVRPGGDCSLSQDLFVDYIQSDRRSCWRLEFGNTEKSSSNPAGSSTGWQGTMSTCC